MWKNGPPSLGLNGAGPMVIVWLPGFAQRQAMAVGRHRSQELAIDLEQHSVQVVANVLLCHGKMRLLQQTQQFLAWNLHRLLRIDVLDDRKFRGRQSRQAETATARLDHHLFPLDSQRYRNLLGQGAQNIQEFAARNRDITGVLNHHLGGSHELHFQISGRNRQLSLAHAKQHIGQYRHGLASFHDPDYGL